MRPRGSRCPSRQHAAALGDGLELGQHGSFHELCQLFDDERALVRVLVRHPRGWPWHVDNRNVFEVLMDAVRVCSLGQITSALFEVGGQYRRNM